MMGVCVPDWGTSRCAFFGSFLFPFSVGERERARHSFLAPTPPSPTSSTPSVVLLSSFLPFFFFCSPPPSSSPSLFRPLDVCQAQLCWPSILCVFLARRLLSFIHPSPPRNQPARLPAPPVHWRSPGLESIVVRLITFHRVDFSPLLVPVNTTTTTPVSVIVRPSPPSFAALDLSDQHYPPEGNITTQLRPQPYSSR